MIERLQRSRKAGSKLPEGTLVVTRPTIWGNPWEGPDAVFAYKLFCEQVIGGSEYITAMESTLRIKRVFSRPIEQWKMLRSEMLGLQRSGVTHVACWCSLDKGCHADVIRAIPFYCAWESGAGIPRSKR